MTKILFTHEIKIELQRTPIMVLGTSSGAGKTLIATAICRYLKRKGQKPIPFKGQNMSNNAWVDTYGREMAYSQALQSWSAGLEPSAEMNPVLLKPKGDSISEVIHLGKSVGTSKARNYYEEWYNEIYKGWITLINFKQHVLNEMNKISLHKFMNQKTKWVNWRTFNPNQLHKLIEKEAY